MVLIMSSLLCFLSYMILSVSVSLDSRNNLTNCKTGPNLNVQDLVGMWMKIYSQPIAVECVILQIRATTDLEREQFSKYGNFSGHVDWNKCLLQVESPFTSGMHFLQGDGNNTGILKNIIIFKDSKGEWILGEETADQWMVFGRRGSELLLIRECGGESRVGFARAPYWPTATELYAILHRAGIAPLAQRQGHVHCDPLDYLTDLLSDRDTWNFG